MLSCVGHSVMLCGGFAVCSLLNKQKDGLNCDVELPSRHDALKQQLSRHCSQNVQQVVLNSMNDHACIVVDAFDSSVKLVCDGSTSNCAAVAHQLQQLLGKPKRKFEANRPGIFDEHELGMCRTADQQDQINVCRTTHRTWPHSFTALDWPGIQLVVTNMPSTEFVLKHYCIVEHRAYYDKDGLVRRADCATNQQNQHLTVDFAHSVDLAALEYWLEVINCASKLVVMSNTIPYRPWDVGLPAQQYIQQALDLNLMGNRVSDMYSNLDMFTLCKTQTEQA